MIADYIRQRRWFRGKARTLASAAIDETFPLEGAELAIVRCTYEDGGEEKYVMLRARGDAPAAHLAIGDGTFDALGSASHLATLLAQIERGTRVAGKSGTLVLRAEAGFSGAKKDVTPKPTDKEQTNTSIVFGDSVILKVVRKLDEGRSAELEMGEFLTKNGYASAPAVLGAIEIERGSGEPATIGIVHRLVPNQGDAWASTLADLARASDPSAYRTRAELLGRRVGEMHVVLARGKDASFAPTRLDKAALAKRVEADARAASKWLDAELVEKAAQRASAFAKLDAEAIAMRVHGDLHLGQILVQGSDFVIIDFEGEPARSLAERKGKRSPLADVAGMVRSFDYAAATALRKSSPGAARKWSRETSRAFLAAWRDATRAALPMDDATFQAALDVHVLEKSLYEIAYEANNRPDWLDIPRDGLRDLLG
ncbi:MAG TPA: phosphotransferase [Labilithrix sp.]